ncbi:D-glycero-beta-D-manno-heptose-7-phosphate kinase [Acanthopleuribacter pedis]|uniref:D-glycero-beta-D-manno-heptose-7-phosphate kinase n=1 Tax=Acanthopleuribacter pedis TaxID=442870 RepID=A0A8J7U6Q4_9BACT|nr:D-glycero-beta-D-manno-heptose-7-phosphate kinase [Acanthopleuribacter pedis]MBO1323012.1 D-glycero-beta-D-manno-heptose-7-phosphate kinase [Acanthopleuribacter pedis]
MEDLTALNKTIDRFGQARIVVVGDMMLDRFIWGKVSRISPEAPVPVVQVTEESAHLGGAANVVCNLEELGCSSVPVGLVGTDATAATFRGLLGQRGVDLSGIVADDAFTSIQKTRIIAQRQQVCRVDREGENVFTEAQHEKVRASLFAQLAAADAVIVSDYGKGSITRPLLEELTAKAGTKIISVDPKENNYDHYHDVTILTPNRNEAEGMAGVRIKDAESLRQAAASIFGKLSCRLLLITLGEHGMALFHAPDDMVHIPTQAREVFDVSGAGDTVIATWTLARAVGATPRQAAVLANAAAGVVVEKLGTATLNRDELRGALKRWNQSDNRKPFV